MRIFSPILYTATFLFFLLVTPVLAAVDATHVGFVHSSIWFDREPFFSGQEVRVYTTLANSSSADFKGVVEFYDGDVAIGSAQVSLERNGGFQVLWTDWVPEEGDHSVSVKIIEATLTPVGGEPEVVSYTEEPEALIRFVDTDTDGDGVGNREDSDDDNDGIPDNVDDEPLVKSVVEESDTEENSVKENLKEKSTKVISKIGNIASSTSPKIIAAAEKTYEAIEEFRTTQSKNIDEKIKTIKHDIVKDEAEDLPDGEKKKNDPFNQLQLLAFTAAGYTLSHKIVFYITGIFIVYILLKKIFPWIYRLIRPKEDF